MWRRYGHHEHQTRGNQTYKPETRRWVGID
jgi:hypothetical protein